MNHFDQVQRAYNELVASGDVHNVAPGPTQEKEIDEQKAYVTRRSAYYINLIDPSYGLLSKTTGTNVQGLSTDIILRKDGTYYDIATDVEVGNQYRAIRILNGGPSFDASMQSRWVQPTKEMAGLTNGEPIPQPPTNPPTDDINAKLDYIIKKMKEYHDEEMAAIAKPRTCQ